MEKYLCTEVKKDGSYLILGIEDLRKRFEKEWNIEHNDQNFCLWMNTHANVSYQYTPEYIPFMTDGHYLSKDYHIDTLRDLATIRHQMNENLDDLFCDDREKNDIADEATWTITFTRNGKSYSTTIPWLAQNYEVMDTTINDLITAELE